MWRRDDLADWVDRHANPVTVAFLTRNERRSWFLLWEQARYGLSPMQQEELVRLTTQSTVKAAEYFTRDRDIDMVFAYDFRILASMTRDQLWAWQEAREAGYTNKAYYIYQNAAHSLRDAEDRAKRTV